LNVAPSECERLEIALAMGVAGLLFLSWRYAF
jgi:hypothetical protein